MPAPLANQENFRKLIDVIADGKSMATATALAYSSKSKIGWVHLRNSKKEKSDGVPVLDAKFALHDWPEDGEHHYLIDAYNMAIQIAKMDFHLEVLEQIRNETESYIQDGKEVYEVDPLLLAQYEDKEDAENLGVTDWPYRHDTNGARIPLKRRVRPAAQMLIAALKAMNPAIWNQPVEVNVRKEANPVLTMGTPPKSARPVSDLESDLRKRLEDLRARGPQKATGPVDTGVPKALHGDPEERVTALSDDVLPDLTKHPRAFWVAAAPPKPEEPISYARPPRNTNRLDGEDRGSMPSGGFVKGPNGQWRAK